MNDTVKYFTKKAVALLAAMAIICIILIPLQNLDYKPIARFVMLCLSLAYLAEKVEWLMQKCGESDTGGKQ